MVGRSRSATTAWCSRRRSGRSDVRATAAGLRFLVKDEILPAPLGPEERPAGTTGTVETGSRPRFRGPRPGSTRFKIDGHCPGYPISGKGRELWPGPELEQVEQLRKTIIDKNRLFFYRWRPQNDTYLFGFRKHEQGNNAIEIPQFDPLVEAKEREIARLRKPVPHVYELIRDGEVAK